MKIKQVVEDFVVDEIFDLNDFVDRDEGRSKPYFYFKLIKRNYTQIKVLEIVADVFNTSRKLVHFAGTKDKVGITSQLVSVYGIDESNYETNLKFLEEKFPDISLEFLGKFKGRVNLGENKGNSFKIVVRDLVSSDILRAKENLKKIESFGVVNFFDEQRFGYANNSHIVGKYVLKNEIELAVKEIMTSMPSNTDSEILPVFVNFVRDNWEGIKGADLEIIDKGIELCPRYLQNEKLMLEHLKKHKNDFPGAFRKIHKKLRMLYINAYQSYIFNEMCLELREKGLLEKYESLPLVSKESVLDSVLSEIAFRILDSDGLSLDSFKPKHMPEIKIFEASRITRNFPRNIVISEVEEDELNEGKVKVLVSFDLASGEYATNVVKQLFD